MRTQVLRVVAAAALTANAVLSVWSAPPAAAFTPPPETALALVSNQNSGCHDEEVVLATPTTGAYSSTLGKPSNILGRLNDAKPFDGNRKVVAVWGEEPQFGANRLGGVGIYDRAAAVPGWTTAFPLPTGWTTGTDGSGAAHSVSVIEQNGVATPDVVVAQTGGIPNAGSWGNVVLMRPTSSSAASVVQTLPLTGVHGVEWDTARNLLFAVGNEYIESYTYDRTRTPPLVRAGSWHLKDVNGSRGGHDIRRRRTGNGATYLVTTNPQVWTFNPSDPNADTALSPYLKPGTTSTVGSGVKSVDERFGGLVEYSYGDAVFHFTDSTPAKTANGFCASNSMKGYKVRWIYAIGDPVYPNDTVAPPDDPSPSQPSAERFLWERHWLTGSADRAMSGEIWAGGGAGDTADSAATKIRNAINAGQIPYVKFYHWGDSGNPTMSGVTSMSSTDSRWDSWNRYAVAMANAIGDHDATVVIEPEWDSNPKAPCMSRYRTELQKVISTFKSLAGNAKLINGVGFWDNGTGTIKDGTVTKSKYYCFQEGTPQLRTLFDGHGFIAHVMSNGNDPDGVPCGRRNDGSLYTDTKTLSQALSFMNGMGARLDTLKKLFATSTGYITDLFVTRCGWGDQGQADIVGALASQLQNNTSNLYATHGLRGVAFRNGGPGAAEAFMGVGNEMRSCYTASCPAQWGGVNNATLAQVEYGRSGMQAYLASITGPVTDPPDFTLTVSNPPSAAPGGTVPITLTVTNTKGSYTNGIVDLEIYDSAGVRVPQTGQRFWTGQSFANGQSRQYQYDWPAAATPGTYRIKAGVFSSAWQNVKWNDNAGSVTVGTAQPAFTATGTATPASLAPDATTTVSATVTDNGGALSNGTVRLQVLAPDGTVADEWVTTGESFATGQSKAYSGTWTAPPAGGTYTVGVVVTSGDGTTTHYSAHDLATVTVTPSKFTSSTTVSRGTVAPGGTSTVTATITNTGGTSLSNGSVRIELYDPNGDALTPATWSGVNLAAGASASYSTTFTAPASPTGAYTVQVAVLSSTGTTLHRDEHAASITVAAVTFELSANASEAKVMPGGPSSITVTVRPTGGGVDNAIVDLEVYDSAGVRLPDPNGRKFWTGQSLADGVAQTYTWAWTAPATLGTYTVKTGVFPANWGPVYKWVDQADTIEVANPSHTMTADVSASSVTPGSPVTITANYTNNGGSMTNGIADLEIYDSAGVRVPQTGQKFWTGESIGYGGTSSHSYTWTPTVAGTYTVRLGVFSSDWSKQWGWKQPAATISVGGSFQPSYRIGDGANSWWFEVYTSDDVTGMDVIADNGRVYASLQKKSWGAWAGSPSSEVLSGQPVQLVARRSSDGSSAASTSFGWLTGTPAGTAGWPAALAKGSGSSTTWVEASAAATAAEVWVKAGTGAWTQLTYSATSGKWGKAMNVATGTKVVFKARRGSDSAWGYSVIYTW